jgi:asparagine synthase (glutamine-hydrolysing)
VRVTAEDAADNFHDAVWSGEMVQYNAHGVARFLLSREVRRAGYKTVLAGEGGDELFAGYHFCSRAVASNGGRSWLPMPLWLRTASRLLAFPSPSRRVIARTSPWLARAVGLFRLPEPLLVGLAEKLEIQDELIDEGFRGSVEHDPYLAVFRALDPKAVLTGREPVKQILYLWMKTIFVNYVLAGERLDMAHSVEVRLPLLDHELFDRVKGIPTSVLARNGTQKWLLREAARPFLTPEVYQGVKRGFLAPPSTLRDGDRLFELLQDTLRGRSMANLPFFDQASVVRVLDGIPSMPVESRGSLDPLIMMMGSLCALQERYRL